MKISLSPLLPTGNFLNVRIGLEQDFPEDTNIETAVNSIWDSITAIHMKRYPHLYNERGEPLYEKVPQEEEMKGSHVRDVVEVNPSISAIMLDMMNCTELSKINSRGVEIGLLAYANDAEKYPELKKAYELKLKELQ